MPPKRSRHQRRALLRPDRAHQWTSRQDGGGGERDPLQGRIEAYELWNEPTHPGYYGGTVERMRDMARRAHQIIKSVDPSALVISPSATMLHRTEVQNWTRRFAELGGYTYADRVAVHLYADGTDHAIVWPERAEPMVATARSVLAGLGGFGNRARRHRVLGRRVAGVADDRDASRDQ